MGHPFRKKLSSPCDNYPDTGGISGASDILSALDKTEEFKDMPKKEKLDICFNLALHQAFAEAIHDLISNSEFGRHISKTDLIDFEKRRTEAIDVLDIETRFALEYELFELNKPLFEAYHQLLQDFLNPFKHDAGTENYFELVLASLDRETTRSLSLILCDTEKYHWLASYTQMELHNRTRSEMKKQFEQLKARNVEASNSDSIKTADTEYKTNSISFEEFLTAVQEQHCQKIYDRHNRLKVIGLHDGIPLDRLYVDLNVFDRASHQSEQETENSEEIINDIKTSLRKRLVSRVPGIKLINKGENLMLLGQPGSGKTTFLQYVALQAVMGKLEDEATGRLPLLVSLRELAKEKDPSILNYISNQFQNILSGGIEVKGFVHELLNKGLAVVLFDGLDEVKKEDASDLLNLINSFCKEFSGSQFIISCRTSSHISAFSDFRSVEVADFDDNQIEVFIQNWFAKHHSIKPTALIKKLNENSRAKELSRTPLLLALICIVYQSKHGFPSNKVLLYESALETLLSDWDAQRGVERGGHLYGLDTKRLKILFSQIAWNTFKGYELLISRSHIEMYITDFILNCNLDITSRTLIKSNEVLQSLENQHGLLVERNEKKFTFSHLTFHEYFTASHLINRPKLLQDQLQNYLCDENWREVYVMIAGISENAGDYLLDISASSQSILTEHDRISTFIKSLNKQDELIRSRQPKFSLIKDKAHVSRFVTLSKVLKESLETRLTYTSYLLEPNELEKEIHTLIDLCLAHSVDLANRLGCYVNKSGIPMAYAGALEFVRKYELNVTNPFSLGKIISSTAFFFGRSSEDNPLVLYEEKEVKSISTLGNEVHVEINKKDSLAILWNLFHYLYSVRLILDVIENASYITRECREKVQEKFLVISS